MLFKSLNNKLYITLIAVVLAFILFLINLVNEENDVEFTLIENKHNTHLPLTKNSYFTDPSYLFFPIDEYNRLFRELNINLEQKIWLKEIFIENSNNITYQEKGSNIKFSPQTSSPPIRNISSKISTIPNEKTYTNLKLISIKREVEALNINIKELTNHSRISFIQIQDIQFAYILNSCGINKIDQILLSFVKYQLNSGKKFSQDIIVDWYAILK